MASPIIGRTDCPECGFTAAHVKRSDKCTYRYCPECNATYHAKTARQVADLMAKTRPEKGAPPAEPAPPKAAPVVVEPAATPAPIKAAPANKPPPKPAPEKRGAFDI